MRKTFIAIGMVLSINTDRVVEILPSVKLEASSYEELLSDIRSKFDSVKESNQRNLLPIGAVFSVCEQTLVDLDGKEFSSESYKIETIGDLNTEQYLQLEELVLERV